jgi:hypothetical protein
MHTRKGGSIAYPCAVQGTPVNELLDVGNSWCCLQPRDNKGAFASNGGAIGMCCIHHSKPRAFKALALQ